MKAKAWIRSFATGAAALILFSGNASAQIAQQRAVKPNPAVNVLAYNGKLSGIVYWDTTKVVRVAIPPGCDGTEVYVWIADQTGLWEAWQTSTLTFSYSMNGSFAICAYTIDRVPIGQPLYVSAHVPSHDYKFKTGVTDDGDEAAVPAPGAKATWFYGWGGGVDGVGAAVTVVSTPCRDFVAFQSAASLTSGPRSCGGEAANVNFVVGSYSDYLKALFAGYGGSAQQLSAAQARVVAQTMRPRQTGGALQAQSAGSKNTGRRAPMSPTTPRLTNPAPTPAPIIGTPQQPLLANGGTPGTLTTQTPGAGTASGSRPTTSAAVAAVNPVGVTPSKTGGPQGSVSLYGSAANTMSKVTIGGTVSGYIFWDRRRVAYNPSVPCQGLTVQLSDITGTGIHQLGSTNPSQAQPTGRTQAGSSLALCSYTFNRVPEGVALQVQVNIGQPFAAQVVAKGPFPWGATGTLVKVAGGPCNNPPSGASLQSGWQSCGDQTSNVNFELVPRRAIRTFPAPNGAR